MTPLSADHLFVLYASLKSNRAKLSCTKKEISSGAAFGHRMSELEQLSECNCHMCYGTIFFNLLHSQDQHLVSCEQKLHEQQDSCSIQSFVICGRSLPPAGSCHLVCFAACRRHSSFLFLTGGSCTLCLSASLSRISLLFVISSSIAVSTVALICPSHFCLAIPSASRIRAWSSRCLAFKSLVMRDLCSPSATFALTPLSIVEIA